MVRGRWSARPDGNGPRLAHQPAERPEETPPILVGAHPVHERQGPLLQQRLSACPPGRCLRRGCGRHRESRADRRTPPGNGRAKRTPAIPVPTDSALTGSPKSVQDLDRRAHGGQVLHLVAAQQRNGNRPVVRSCPLRWPDAVLSSPAAPRGPRPARPLRSTAPSARRPRPGITAITASCCAPAITGRPALMMPLFSRAIVSMSGPRYCVCSRLMRVRTDTRGSTTLVASSLPPMPVSSTTTRTPWRRK